MEKIKQERVQDAKPGEGVVSIETGWLAKTYEQRCEGERMNHLETRGRMFQREKQ